MTKSNNTRIFRTAAINGKKHPALPATTVGARAIPRGVAKSSAANAKQVTTPVSAWFGRDASPPASVVSPIPHHGRTHLRGCPTSEPRPHARNRTIVIRVKRRGCSVSMLRYFQLAQKRHPQPSPRYRPRYHRPQISTCVTVTLEHSNVRLKERAMSFRRMHLHFPVCRRRKLASKSLVNIEWQLAPRGPTIPSPGNQEPRVGQGRGNP